MYTTFLVLVLTVATAADEPGRPPANAAKLTLPTVSFTFDFPRGRPAFFSVTVDSAGRTVYESRDQGFPEEPAESAPPYRTSFLVSAGTRERILELATALNHFRGDFDYRKRRIADMGRKTLAWSDGVERTSTTYNWSENGHIDELTAIFMRISNTQEFGRRLEFLRRHDRLGLESELKSMEERAKDPRFGLAELQTIEPLLRSIAADPAVMRIARQRAERLLASIPGQGTGAPTPH